MYLIYCRYKLHVSCVKSIAFFFFHTSRVILLIPLLCDHSAAIITDKRAAFFGQRVKAAVINTNVCRRQESDPVTSCFSLPESRKLVCMTSWVCKTVCTSLTHALCWSCASKLEYNWGIQTKAFFEGSLPFIDGIGGHLENVAQFNGWYTWYLLNLVVAKLVSNVCSCL